MDSQHIITFLLVLILPNLFVLGASSSSPHNNNIFTCLINHFETSNSSISDVIYTPKNTSYESILQPINLRPASTSPLKPILIITPVQDSQIQAAIICSKEHNVQIRIRSGGHDFEGISYTSRVPFIIVDMRNLRSISINAEEKTAWIQVGATLGELYYTIAQASRTLAFAAGVSRPVGIGGHLSGGGYGMMSRKHSIASDHIIDAKLVDADGQILDRESMGDDLFWAIRGGGGGNFGIVVEFKVKLVTVPEIVTVFNVSKTLEQNATELVHKWQYIADKVDDNLLLRLFLKSITSPTTGNRTVIASFTTLFLGRVRDLMPIMQENFPELGLVEEDCIEMSWIESIMFFAGFQNQSLDVLLDRTATGGVYFKDKSDYVKQPFPVHGLRGIWRFLNEEDENMAELQFSPYGGAFNNFSESETPFPHRSGNIFMIEYAVIWTRPGYVESQRHLNWMRRLYSYMAPYVSKSPREAYVNYRDLEIGMNNEGNTSYAQASVWGRKYFKNNFDRLVRVKTKVDPSNFFRNEQSIPPMLS